MTIEAVLNHRFWSGLRHLTAVNTSGEEIPPHGCVYINSCGYEIDYVPNGKPDAIVFEVTKPPAGDAALIGIVDEAELLDAPGKYGVIEQAAIHRIGSRFAFNGLTPISRNGIGSVTTDMPVRAWCGGSTWGTSVLAPRKGSFRLQFLDVRASVWSDDDEVLAQIAWGYDLFVPQATTLPISGDVSDGIFIIHRLSGGTERF